MTDKRSERLRRRRKQSTARTDSQEEEVSQSPTQPEEKKPETPAQGENSVKEEQIGTYMYLPESQTKDLRRQYNILKAEYEFEYDEEFQKNRHFYPLAIQYGLDSLEKMDASDIKERLEEIL